MIFPTLAVIIACKCHLTWVMSIYHLTFDINSHKGSEKYTHFNIDLRD